MDEILAKASGNIWVLIGSGIGMVLAALLLAIIGTLREWIYNLIPKMINKMRSYPGKQDAKQTHQKRYHAHISHLRKEYINSFKKFISFDPLLLVQIHVPVFHNRFSYR